MSQPHPDLAEPARISTRLLEAGLTMTPRFCFEPAGLRDFLRLSRSSSDDQISQNLNALLTPGANPWNSPTLSRRTSSHRAPIPPQSCAAYVSKDLFPAWQMRTDALTYCAHVATSPDPSDPDLLRRADEDARARDRVVDERLDPYSGRYFPREARTEALASLVRNEREIEKIVRSRTWAVILERCAGQETNPEKALEKWNREDRRELRSGASIK